MDSRQNGNMKRSRVIELTLDKGLLNNKILTDSESLICLQSNCVARKKHNLSLHDDLYKTLGFGDPYKKRRGKLLRNSQFSTMNNLARKEDQPQLGSMLSYRHPKFPDNYCKLAFLFAQYNMGNGKKYYFADKEYRKNCQKYEHSNTTLSNIRRQRLYNFKHCLATLLNSHTLKFAKNILFPNKIGCAFAGGVWVDYKLAIHAFASLLDGDKKVFIISKK
uniref:Wsv206-like protein n=1 Tax=Pasiphaea japonica whispovirus TaxID=2984286 RepID=A0A9C7CEX6_9VIRU|nr:MAG: wsv206-like protein [Pasiphaea japonica whispovirus]